MISTHDGRKRGGIWLKIKPQIRVLAYTLPISFFSDSRRLRRLNINLFFWKFLSLQSVQILVKPWEKDRCQTYAKEKAN